MTTRFSSLPSPCYVADAARIRANLAKAAWLKAETGCHMLLATKAFSMFSLFPMFAEVLDGTTASGLFEARLGHEHFGGEVHAYSPAYSPGEIEALLPIVSHLYFNSVGQLKEASKQFSAEFLRATESRAGEQSIKLGLRLNPRLSLVKNSSLYDPSAPGSRFGVQREELSDDVLALIDTLHVHNLCENLAEDSVALIDHLIATVPHALEKVESINLGGGHYITHPDYDLSTLADAINRLQRQFDLQVILEPGGALVYDAGYLVATVLDLITTSATTNSQQPPHTIAILDTSATCHMPDVLEVPYTPRVQGASILEGENAGHAHYTLSGKTCLTGDTIGHYDFAHPLAIGDQIIFEDMMQYTMVKNTTFNGLPLPAIAILEEGSSTRVVKEFSYNDFKQRLS